MTTLQTYYFEKQPTGDWYVNDEHGSGDMVLENDDVNTYVTSGMLLRDDDRVNDTQVYVQAVELKTIGFDTLHGTVVLHIKDGSIQRAALHAINFDKVLIHSLSRFRLTLPYFIGTRIPDECD